MDSKGLEEMWMLYRELWEETKESLNVTVLSSLKMVSLKVQFENFKGLSSFLWCLVIITE